MTIEIALLGDSILDNASYVAPGEEVQSELERAVPAEWAVSLLARDGAVLAGVPDQMRRLPPTATHLIVSAGGNDALRNSIVLREGARSVAEAVAKVADIRDQFARAYEEMLHAVLRPGLPVAVCTIYDVPLREAFERRLALTALSVLNDAILREASRRRLPVIDLRVIFNEPADFANEIEPSGQGSRKIAAAVARLVREHDFAGPSALYS